MVFMISYTPLVAFLLLFLAVGVGFIFFHLVAGKFFRPNKPDAEKMTIYECGEPTIGSAWIQFDLRFYVVALLFVIFDVEVAFFFPWAVVFGKASVLANAQISQAKRDSLSSDLVTPGSISLIADDTIRGTPKITADDARVLAWFAFGDIAVFFGVLLVGFAYLWRRGDLDWVRSITAEQPALEPSPGVPLPAPERPP